MFNFLFGCKPKAGLYALRGTSYTKWITENDLLDNYVWVRFVYSSDDLMSFRSFHFSYKLIKAGVKNG